MIRQTGFLLKTKKQTNTPPKTNKQTNPKGQNMQVFTSKHQPCNSGRIYFCFNPTEAERLNYSRISGISCQHIRWPSPSSTQSLISGPNAANHGALNLQAIKWNRRYRPIRGQQKKEQRHETASCGTGELCPGRRRQTRPGREAPWPTDAGRSSPGRAGPGRAGLPRGAREPGRAPERREAAPLAGTAEGATHLEALVEGGQGHGAREPPPRPRPLSEAPAAPGGPRRGRPPPGCPHRCLPPPRASRLSGGRLGYQSPSG